MSTASNKDQAGDSPSSTEREQANTPTPETLRFSSDVPMHDVVAIFPGEIHEYVLYRSNDGEVALLRARRTGGKSYNLKVNNDGTISLADPSRPSGYNTDAPGVGGKP